MNVEFCQITVPHYLCTNVMDCPIKYCLRKYNFNFKIPQPFKCDKTSYVVCLPSTRYVDFVRAIEDQEGCTYKWLKTEYVCKEVFETAKVSKINNEYMLDHFENPN
jgi:hypothetical protein